MGQQNPTREEFESQSFGARLASLQPNTRMRQREELDEGEAMQRILDSFDENPLGFEEDDD